MRSGGWLSSVAVNPASTPGRGFDVSVRRDRPAHSLRLGWRAASAVGLAGLFEELADLRVLEVVVELVPALLAHAGVDVGAAVGSRGGHARARGDIATGLLARIEVLMPPACRR